MTQNSHNPVRPQSEDKTLLYAVLAVAIVIALPILCLFVFFLGSAVLSAVTYQIFRTAPLVTDTDIYNYEEDLEQIEELDSQWAESYALELGLDLEQFRADINDPMIRDRVDADIAEGEGRSVRGTPTYIVNGVDRGATTVLEGLIQDEIDAGNTPVIVEEYIDLQCPFCKQSHTAKKDLQAKFGSQVRFIHKHFPLQSIHPYAYVAAVAAEAAREQGKFDEFVELIFEHQDELTEPQFGD